MQADLASLSLPFAAWNLAWKRRSATPRGIADPGLGCSKQGAQIAKCRVVSTPGAPPLSPAASYRDLGIAEKGRTQQYVPGLKELEA